MPSATGANWEKHQKNFDDEEKEEKKIAPLTDEYVMIVHSMLSGLGTNTCESETSKSSRRTTPHHTPQH